ncbi:phage integrase [Chromohalobacter canadensis]|uniref:phage integrase n=1 Tax=Chromohalobacter canadensis TaxID=141389 RepID=UPI0024100426|nr:tyrosine-type recombinase/integrase [Chromohalobacter canadensis]
MAVKKQEDGTWLVDFRGNGKGSKRFRKKFKTKGEALRYMSYVKTKVVQQPDWNPPKKDMRRLSDLIMRWYEIHGKHSKSGESRKSRLLKLAEVSGNPTAENLNAGWFVSLREVRSKDVSANTLNHDRAYLSAMFNELRRVGEWGKENPIKDSRKIKYDERELRYLSKKEIEVLLDKLSESRNKSALLITKVCLATGARWSEAETLRRENVKDGKISFWSTKNGKARHIPIGRELEEEVLSHGGSGRLFRGSYEAFSNAIRKANIELPEGQMTHVLRHTFASHFIMQGGSILTLQRILDHSTITMTMRYAHLSPDHLEEAKSLNALEVIK